MWHPFSHPEVWYISNGQSWNGFVFFITANLFKIQFSGLGQELSTCQAQQVSLPNPFLSLPSWFCKVFSITFFSTIIVFFTCLGHNFLCHHHFYKVFWVTLAAVAILMQHLGLRRLWPQKIWQGGLLWQFPFYQIHVQTVWKWRLFSEQKSICNKNHQRHAGRPDEELCWYGQGWNPQGAGETDFEQTSSSSSLGPGRPSAGWA